MPGQPPFLSGSHLQEEASRDFEASGSAQFTDHPVERVHEAVSRFLGTQIAAQQAGEVRSFGAESLTGPGNIVGVGIGVSMPRSTEWIAEPGIPSLRVYLLEPMEEGQLRHLLSTELGAGDAARPEIPIEAVVTGEIRAQPHTFRDRPAPGGISVGHENISAGTLGCLATGRSGERQNRTLILSNNHVLADTNAGSFGDKIVQPGPLDGGHAPGDQIAALERFVPIGFGGSNEVDCATGWADPEQVRRELVYLDSGSPRYFQIASTPRRAKMGEIVGKSGRTTQLTTGRVGNITATIRVRYGARVALFHNQIEIVPTPGNSAPFSSGGDSGSVIWSMDEKRSPVGLLFAGGGNSTFANHMDQVLLALDIDLVT